MAAAKGNKYALGCKTNGQKPVYKKEFDHLASSMCRLGATDADLAHAFNVSIQTINNWKIKYESFALALKEDKSIADDRVKRSLYQKAIGYSHEDTDIRVIDGQIVQTTVIKHYPPSDVACIFWLKNRQKEEWRQTIPDGEGQDGPVVYNSPSHSNAVDDTREGGAGDL